MKRYLANGLGLALVLLASNGRSDDVIWRAPRDRTVQPAGSATSVGNGASEATATEGGITEPPPTLRDDAPPSTPVLISSRKIPYMRGLI